MVTLKNKQRRMRAFNLDSPFFVKRHGETLYGRPEALTLLSLERRENLPDAVLACTEIKAALDSDTLRAYPSPEPAGILKQSEDRPKPGVNTEPKRSARRRSDGGD